MPGRSPWQGVDPLIKGSFQGSGIAAAQGSQQHLKSAIRVLKGRLSPNLPRRLIQYCHMGRTDGASEKDRTSDLLITNEQLLLYWTDRSDRRAGDMTHRTASERSKTQPDRRGPGKERYG